MNALQGSYVPASRMRLSPVDRVFTRIGARDQLAAGQSTFMVELYEMLTILRSASRHSLVIVDELGRGTATHDGLALAEQVLVHLCARVPMPRTLFATHYHQLVETAVEVAKERVRPMHMVGQVWMFHDSSSGVHRRRRRRRRDGHIPIQAGRRAEFAVVRLLRGQGGRRAGEGMQFPPCGCFITSICVAGDRTRAPTGRRRPDGHGRFLARRARQEAGGGRQIERGSVSR